MSSSKRNTLPYMYSYRFMDHLDPKISHLPSLSEPQSEAAVFTRSLVD